MLPNIFSHRQSLQNKRKRQNSCCFFIILSPFCGTTSIFSRENDFTPLRNSFEESRTEMTIMLTDKCKRIANYRPQCSCGKVIILHLSVILSMGDTPWADTPLWADPPQTATGADGTHPTGMHSC